MSISLRILGVTSGRNVAAIWLFWQLYRVHATGVLPQRDTIRPCRTRGIRGIIRKVGRACRLHIGAYLPHSESARSRRPHGSADSAAASTHSNPVLYSVDMLLVEKMRLFAIDDGSDGNNIFPFWMASLFRVAYLVLSACVLREPRGDT